MKTLITLLLLTPAIVGKNFANAQASFLEIHHVGAGDGDATLILSVDYTGATGIDGLPVTDTCVVLIDGQRPGSAGGEVWRYVRDTVSARFHGRRPIIDYLVASHLHEDHIGGLIDVMDNAYSSGWVIRYAVTRDKLITGSTSTCQIDVELDDCYDNTTPKPVTTQVKSTFLNTIKGYNISEPIIQPTDNLFRMMQYSFTTISMECVVAGGATIDPISNQLYSFLPCKSGSNTNVNENDLSYGWLITFGGFHYLSLGDLGGTDAPVDGEGAVTNYLINYFDNPDYHLCANKVSHHGSKSSSSVDFVYRNKLTLPIIPANLRTYGYAALPTETAITNLLTLGSTAGQPINQSSETQIIYTFIPKNPSIQSSYWQQGNLDYYNDVILKLNENPGKGQNLSYWILEVPKDQDYDYSNALLPPVKQYQKTCTKGHNW